jgi:ComF family protein
MRRSSPTTSFATLPCAANGTGSSRSARVPCAARRYGRGIGGLLDLLVPEQCAACGRSGSSLCDRCRGLLVHLRPPLCSRCGAPVAWPVSRCRECAGRRISFEHARAAVAYESVATRLVAAWKEGGRRLLARDAGQIVAELVPRPDVDAIACIPGVSERVLWRGHNPPRSLARELAGHWELPLVPALSRIQSTRPQRGLSGRERRRNVTAAFGARSSPPRTLALVDDVYTTGSTLSAAAAVLRRAGADRIEVVTFARALRSA